jgi:hypothetical protein
MSCTRLLAENKPFLGMILIVIACVFIAGCSVNAFKNLKVQVGASPIRVDGRSFTVFTVAALNTGEESVNLRFSSGMQFDFVVVSGDTEIWRWSHDKVATMMLTERDIAPDELAIHSVVWDGSDLTHRQVAPGEYQVFGEILTKPKVKTDKATFYWPGN